MAKIHPFKAIRPTRDKVHLVATRPYYTYKKSILRAKLEDNPYTFLHIINPEFGDATIQTQNLKERFNAVSQAYKRFISDGILIQDVAPHIYLYRQTKDGNEFLGVVAGASIAEYTAGKIKKHEDTLTSREKMFTEYLDVVGYDAEPVLLSYLDPTERIDVLMQEKIKERPEYEYMTTDRIKHELWILNSEEGLRMQDAFDQIPEVYIADGHHRSASSAGLQRLRKSQGGTHFPNEDFFLAFFMNESRLQILAFHRLIRKLEGKSEMDFLLELSDHFEVEPLPKRAKPKQVHDMTMCLRGYWYLLRCKPELLQNDHPVETLDASILTHHILAPLLSISDLKTNENIDFISGTTKIKKIEKMIKAGEYDIAFCLYPISMSEVRRVADHGMTMPPKTTWVEPKLRSGLTIYSINE